MMKQKVSVKKNKEKKAGIKKREGIQVFNLSGELVETLPLPKHILEIKDNPRLLAQAIRVYLSNQRQGTASTKTRAEVRGGGKKMWKQKGTGRARQGSRRAPHWRGGGIVFGPKPRDFSLELPKKMKKQALLLALKEKVKTGKLKVLEGLEKITGKTKEWAKTFSGKKTLLVLSQKEELLERGVKNIPEAEVTTFNTLNIWLILSNKELIFTKESFGKLNKLDQLI